jgi:hypothetical protein
MRRTNMSRLPIILSALHVSLVGAATWLVVASDLLDSAPLLFIR